MAAFLNSPVRRAVVRAESLFPGRRVRSTGPLTCVWRRDAEGRLVRAWGREPEAASTTSGEPIWRAVAA